MTDATPQLTIGQLARRTGVSVRTIRFWSDEGLLGTLDRTEAGYRLYDVEALARLELVQTLRALEVDLPTIRRVLAREASLAEVAATHATAVDAQLRTLRLRRAVLRAVARGTPDRKEIHLMSRLATLSDDERRRIVDAFVDETFAGIDAGAEVQARMRAVAPDLPDDPTPEQVEAWVELAELVRDPAFRAVARGMAERAQAEPEASTDGFGASPAAAKAIATRAGAALAEGVDPASDRAASVVEELLAETGEPPSRRELADRIAAFADERVERYWQLLGTINGWPPVPPTVPAWTWFADALLSTAR